MNDSESSSSEARCESCSHALTWHDDKRIPPCTHLVEGHDCNCLGFEEPGDGAAEEVEPFEHIGPAGPLLPGTREAVAKAFDKAFPLKEAPPPCPHSEWEVTHEEHQGGGKIFQYRQCQNCKYAWAAIISDPDLEAETNEAPEGAQAAPEAPSRPPLAVVYRIAGEAFYEVLVPGDAVVSVQDGALAISHPDRPVTGLMQVRPHGETP